MSRSVNAKIIHYDVLDANIGNSMALIHGLAAWGTYVANDPRLTRPDRMDRFQLEWSAPKVKVVMGDKYGTAMRVSFATDLLYPLAKPDTAGNDSMIHQRTLWFNMIPNPNPTVEQPWLIYDLNGETGLNPYKSADWEKDHSNP
jgi:hypothetical protein